MQIEREHRNGGASLGRNPDLPFSSPSLSAAPTKKNSMSELPLGISAYQIPTFPLYKLASQSSREGGYDRGLKTWKILVKGK